MAKRKCARCGQKLDVTAFLDYVSLSGRPVQGATCIDCRTKEERRAREQRAAHVAAQRAARLEVPLLARMAERANDIVVFVLFAVVVIGALLAVNHVYLAVNPRPECPESLDC